MRAVLDPRIPLFDGNMECQSCHSLTATAKDLLRAWGSPKEMCLGCHDYKTGNRLANNNLTELRPALLGALVK
jgi:predicted CXXCH cytochrome family protein